MRLVVTMPFTSTREDPKSQQSTSLDQKSIATIAALSKDVVLIIAVAGLPTNSEQALVITITLRTDNDKNLLNLKLKYETYNSNASVSVSKHYFQRLIDKNCNRTD